MKKIILCLSLVVLVSTCFATNAMAEPKITEIQGGYGVTATVLDATFLRWQINITGPHVISGMKTMGIISERNATIQTPIFPPAFGVGKIHIKVAINRIILPDVIETRTAFMLGPFVLNVHNTPKFISS